MAVFLFFPLLGVSGQAAPAAPLKCWEYQIEIPPNTAPASDNKSEIYLPAADGSLQAVNLNGEFLWRSPISGGLRSALLYHRNRLFLLTSHSDNAKNPTLFAISTVTGLTTWQTPLNELPIAEDQLANLIITDDRKLLLEFAANRLFFDAETGTPDQHEPTATSTDYINANTKTTKTDAGQAVDATEISAEATDPTPITKIHETFYIFRNRDKLTVTDAGKIQFLRRGMQPPVWSARTGATLLSVSEYENFVIASSADNYLYCFRRTDGKMLWRRRFDSKIRSTVLPEQKLVVSSLINGSSTLLTNLTNGRAVTALNASNDAFFVAKPILVGNKILLFENKRVVAYQYDSCKTEKGS